MRSHKFLHNWLPLKAAKHMNKHTEEQWCPSYHHPREDYWHFLECPHPTCVLAFAMLQFHQNTQWIFACFRFSGRGFDPFASSFQWMSNKYKTLYCTTICLTGERLAGVNYFMAALQCHGQKESQQTAKFSQLYTFLLPSYHINLEVYP